MRRRFFVHQFAGDRAVMEGEPAHHVGRVLRAERGQLYELSDGTRVRLARVETVNRDRIEFALLEELQSYQPKLETTLLLSVVKFEAFEWVLEKATELGVSTIVPMAAARSGKPLLAAATKRADRWKKILFEASQQSRRARQPALEPLTKSEEAFRAHKDAEPLRIILSERASARSLRAVLGKGAGWKPALQEGEVKSPVQTVLAIGPEGGWTDDELQAATGNGFQEASLGKLILRTETAVIAALAALNYALGAD